MVWIKQSAIIGKKLLGWQSKNWTKHLHDHHRSCKMKPNKNMKQQTLLQQQWMTDGKMGLSTYKFDPEVSRRELACMIIMHKYPLAIVDHEGFIKYSSSLQPLFKIPCQNTVKANILKIYEVEKSKIMELFNKNSSRISINIDM